MPQLPLLRGANAMLGSPWLKRCRRLSNSEAARRSVAVPTKVLGIDIPGDLKYREEACGFGGERPDIAGAAGGVDRVRIQLKFGAPPINRQLTDLQRVGGLLDEQFDLMIDDAFDIRSYAGAIGIPMRISVEQSLETSLESLADRLLRICTLTGRPQAHGRRHST